MPPYSLEWQNNWKIAIKIDASGTYLPRGAPGG